MKRQTNFQGLLQLKNVLVFIYTEAVFLIVCDPSMNELWAT